MKWFALFMALTLFGSGCQLSLKEQELANRQAALDLKEKELVLKETALELKEAELLRLEYKLDSLRLRDTAYMYDPKIVGQWLVRMVCTGSSCPSSALGDTRTETWELSYLENALMAKAMSGNQLIRVYTGRYSDGNVVLTSETEAATPEQLTTNLVQLSMVNDQMMEGRRQIVRGNGCRIVYDLQLSKL